MNNNFLKIGYILLVLIFVVLILNVVFPGYSKLAFEIHNTGHTPAFGILSLLALAGIHIFLKEQLKNYLMHYLIAFVFAMGLGVCIEFYQYLGPRDADIVDIIRDFAGVTSFLGIFIFFDRRVWNSINSSLLRFKVPILIIAIFALMLSLTPLGLTAAATYCRNQIFPNICTFDNWWEEVFIRTYNADLETFETSSRPDGSSNKAGRLLFKSSGYSSFIIEESYPNWSEYNQLKFDINSPLTERFELGLRIENYYHTHQHDDRYNQIFTINPGINNIAIPLSQIETAPIGRNMDMQKIGPLHIFVRDVANEFTIEIDNFRLE